MPDSSDFEKTNMEGDLMSLMSLMQVEIKATEVQKGIVCEE